MSQLNTSPSGQLLKKNGDNFSAQSKIIPRQLAFLFYTGGDMKTTALHIRISESLKADLRQEAARLRVKPSELARVILAERLAESPSNGGDALKERVAQEVSR